MRVTRHGTNSDIGDLAMTFTALLALAAALLVTIVGIAKG